jgi:hypothetical protein
MLRRRRFRAPRMKSVLVAVLIAFFAGAFLPADAAAHGGHARGAHPARAMSQHDATPAVDIGGDAAAPTAIRHYRAGDGSALLSGDPSGAGDECPDQAEICCTQHCCVGLALIAAPPDTAEVSTGALRAVRSGQGPPDTAPSTPLRPPSC